MANLFTAEEIAAQIRLSPDTIRSWTRDRIIPAVRINSKIIRYDSDAVIDALLRLSDQRQAAPA